MDEIIRELKNLGLSDKEADVYLAALELGPSVVQDIANKSRVNRATTYVMIESLARRGLMSEFVKGKKRYYLPESPERLLSILRLQRQELEAKETDVSKALPMLMALYNVEGAKPLIRYFEGPEGVQTVRELFEKQKGDYAQIVPLDDAQRVKELVEGREEHIARLTSQGINARALLVIDRPESIKYSKAEFAHRRFIPHEKFPIHGEITIRDNTVFLFSYKSSIISVIITSKEIAGTMLALFELAWDGAEDYSK